MPQDVHVHTQVGWLLIAVAVGLGLIGSIVILRGNSRWATRAAVPAMTVLLVGVGITQLWWTPSVPNGILMGQTFFNATPMAPGEPVRCFSFGWLRSNGMWPLGRFAGRVGNVSGTPGHYGARLTTGGGHFPVHEAEDWDGIRHLVLVRSDDCYVDYIFNG